MSNITEIALGYATRIATGADNERFQRVWIEQGDDGMAVVYATDSYIACRIATDYEYGGVPRSISVAHAKKGMKLIIGGLIVNSDEDHPKPNVDRIFESTLERATIFDYRRAVGGPDTRVSEWSYYDDERRRPGGVFKLTAVDLGPPNMGKADIMFERGLKVDTHEKLTQGGSGFYWSGGADRPLGTVEGKVDRLPNGKDDYLGVYNASYLWPIEHAGVIGWESAHKPLYMATPNRKAEFICMGIRL